MQVLVGMNVSLWGQGMSWEGDRYGEVIGPNSGECGLRPVGKEMPSQKGYIWRGRLAMGEEASVQIKICNRELRTIDHLVERFPSGHARLGQRLGSYGEGLLREGVPRWESRTGFYISEDSVSLVGAGGGPETEHVGQLHGASHR